MSDLALQVRALIAAGEGYQRAFAAAVGFGRTDVAALGHLYHGGPQTPTHLADRLHLTGSTVTGLADRMVTAGYVTRSRFPEDRRRVLLALTPAGRRLIEGSRTSPRTLTGRLVLPHRRCIVRFPLSSIASRRRVRSVPPPCATTRRLRKGPASLRRRCLATVG